MNDSQSHLVSENVSCKGTRWEYMKGHRCDACRKAHRDYQREYMRTYAKRKKLGLVRVREN